MTIKEQIKILDDKITQNKADYLYRQNTKISALSSGALNKYEYLTGEDLGYKADPVQKAKFGYNPLGELFSKGLDKHEKQEGLLKRLNDTEDKTDEQLLANKDNKDSQLGIKSVGYMVKELSQEAKNILEKLTNQEKLINYKKLRFTGGNKVDYNFSDYRSLKELFKAIYYRNHSIEKAERIQDEFDGVFDALEIYAPKKESCINDRKSLLTNSKKFYEGRQMIINAFKNKIFDGSY